MLDEMKRKRQKLKERKRDMDAHVDSVQIIKILEEMLEKSNLM